ncbi:LysR family transcriptional regulator [Aeromicrobium sp. A1-2]|uniref:LysR family transcriptional regulator n=1 Tax=Aeromicrobium sp. A1-2 TaxID=2107713 RepID=UPI001C1FF91C|nr:LysR family transcriptional regulator [Aeromicrobium sp. A1-2]
MDLESLRLIVLVQQHGSLGAAARALGISQPAASARLRAVEARHSLSLVTRSPRGSVLTDDGRAVCAWAERVITEADHLEAGLAALGTRRRGDLKVAASLTIAEYLMPRWLADLRRLQPEVHAGLVVVNSTDVMAQVRSSRVRIGFIESPALDSDLHSRVVGHDRLAVVVPHGHPWAGRDDPIGPEELAASALVVREPGSGTRETFDRAVGAQPLIAMQAGSTAAILGAAANGVGPGIVSEIAARQAISSGSLVDVAVSVDLSRTLRAVWLGSERLRSPARDLVEIASRGKS